MTATGARRATTRVGMITLDLNRLPRLLVMQPVRRGRGCAHRPIPCMGLPRHFSTGLMYSSTRGEVLAHRPCSAMKWSDARPSPPGSGRGSVLRARRPARTTVPPPVGPAGVRAQHRAVPGGRPAARRHRGPAAPPRTRRDHPARPRRRHDDARPQRRPTPRVDGARRSRCPARTTLPGHGLRRDQDAVAGSCLNAQSSREMRGGCATSQFDAHCCSE